MVLSYENYRTVHASTVLTLMQRRHTLPGHERLPTEFEWEIAARGKKGRIYPWGNEPSDDTRANFDYRIGHTTSVGSYPKGATPNGIYDMAGNVWEMIDAVWEEYHWGTKKEGRLECFPLCRGGAWITPARNLKSTYRGCVPHHFVTPFIGFRCAKDAH